MKLELIERWEDVAALEPEWNALLGSSHANTIFLTWEWIETWRRVTDGQARPFVLSVRNGEGALLGLAPFYLTELRLLNAIPYRTLRIMGDYSTGAEYPGWIARAGREAEVFSFMAATLTEARSHWDCIWMPNVAGWLGVHEPLLEACRAAGYHCHARPKNFSGINLPADMEQYWQALSSNARSQVRRQTKKILGPDTAIVRCLDADELPRWIETLFELHHRRWKQVGDDGAFLRKPLQARFYQEFTKRALEQRWLWLFGLQERGAFKALQIGYVYDNVFHQLQEGFDPDYTDGVGNVLRAKVIEACIADGIRTYDFLGGMTEHKRRWLAEPRTGYDLFIGHPSVKNRMLFTREVWPTGRFLRPANLPLPNAAAAEPLPANVSGAIHHV